MDSINNTLSPKPLPLAARHHLLRTHVIPKGTRIVHKRDVPNPDQVNSGIEYMVQIGDVMDAKLRVGAMLMAQMMKEPCFNILRTKEQLGNTSNLKLHFYVSSNFSCIEGYIVFSGIRKQTGMVGLRIIVQSEKCPWILEDRINSFLQTFRVSIFALIFCHVIERGMPKLIWIIYIGNARGNDR
jgi:insulysin